MRNQKHGILPRSIQAKDHQNFPISGIVTCNRTPPFSLRFYIAMFRHFQGLQLFRLFNLLTIVAHFPPFALSLSWPSLITCYASSDLPIPLFTSGLHRRCCLHHYRPIPTSREESLASWNSAPTNLLVLLPALVAHSNHGLHSFPLADCMQVYNAQCDVSRMGNKGIAFLHAL